MISSTCNPVSLAAVVEDPDMGIVLPDGTRLSARVWMPQDATERRVPAILEFLPYRKRDGTAARDQINHPYFASHGYACLRVDMRGCGDSEGLFDDEYSPQELRDALDTIAWIADQDWCSGQVGMMGISWGGFNSLQVAALRPEPLKAVVTVCSSVDRYADDIHYKGGCMLGENIGWAATATSWFSMPPDPEIVGDGWKESWIARLENTPFLARNWLTHQHRDAYWRHGSICEDYPAIDAAVLSVGGWHDGYRNTISHLVRNLSSPVKGIVGPWNHKYPHLAVPGPQIGFLQEALRWWDRWLKNIDTGVDNDPAYTAWLMDSVHPETSFAYRPGRWITEAEWPSLRIEARTMYLGSGTIGDAPPRAFRLHVHPATACGMTQGEYFPFGFGPGELPDDQRADDALSLCFDSAEATEATDIVGAPRIRLKIACDRPRAQIAVRLCDLRPDGTSALITMGCLNLRHRANREHPQDLVPGEEVEIDFALDEIAYRLPEGHRLRVAVSTSLWPFIWPEAEPVTATLSAGELVLPVRPTADADERAFPEPAGAPALPVEVVGVAEGAKRVETDMTTGETRIVISGTVPRTRDLTTDLVTGSQIQEIWSIRRNDPASAQVNIVWDRTMGRGDWETRTVVTTRMWADIQNFYVTQRLEAFEGERMVFHRDYQDSVPRV
ncbi:CocE/NonD family hydrolase [Mesorhizobium sp. CAU 1732]|uniref:CocE/NonD family hydrolase n=1 Tax=Mesorhizobium sp. CAU 1732 TaxID=3140358 RepID=UPI003261CA9E